MTESRAVVSPLASRAGDYHSAEDQPATTRADRRPLAGKRIVLGVCGSIAAYKAADLASKLRQAGALVDTVMTRGATEFITPLALRAVTGWLKEPVLLLALARRRAASVAA